MDKFKSDEPKKQSKRRSAEPDRKADDEDEEALWELAVEDVAPMKGRSANRVDVTNAPKRKTSRAVKQKSKMSGPLAPPEGGAQAKTRHVDTRLLEKVRRGKIPIEARIDLHGMNRDEAYAALVKFLESAAARGVRMTLVITGKGGESANPLKRGGGVLQRLTPEWLNAPPLEQKVLIFSAAKPKDGGSGALYVYLRKSL